MLSWGGSSREAKAGDHRTDTEARGQLRIACQMLGAMEMEAFAERARRELLTTARQPVSAPPSPPARRPARLADR
jgi:hypothetical protein